MSLKYRVIERFRGKYSVEAMCEVFGVSRSGYYAWRKRQGKEAKDQWLVDLIVQCQSYASKPMVSAAFGAGSSARQERR